MAVSRPTADLGQVNSAGVNPLDIQLRPAAAGDEAFLRRVHDASRDWDLGQLENQIDRHLYETIFKQQFEAQQSQYFEHFDVARYAVIEWCGIGVGRLYCDFRETEIAVLDIGLLRQARGKGIAGIILRALCRQASLEQKRVTLCVHPLNARACAFYTKLGFRPVGKDRGFVRMDWRDPRTTPARFETG